jgi:hypothetical protein
MHLQEGVSVFDVSSKEKQRAHFVESQLRSQVSSWSIDAMEVVLKCDIAHEDIVRLFNPFPTQPKKDSKLRVKLEKILGEASGSFVSWKQAFDRIFPTPEAITELLSEMEVSPERFKYILDREFSIRPVVPLWLSELLDKALEYFLKSKFTSCKKSLDKLLAHQQWDTIENNPAILKKIRIATKPVRDAIKDKNKSMPAEQSKNLIIEDFKKLFKKMTSPSS